MGKHRIIKIPILPMGMINAFLIVGDDGLVLVDTGLPGSHKVIRKVLDKHSFSFTDIKLIVITHAHTDHAGSAVVVAKLSGAPIVAHDEDTPFYRQEELIPLDPTGITGRFLLLSGLSRQPYKPFVPDILMKGSEVFDLKPYGVAGEVRHTPGHTDGSLSVLLDSKDAVIADMVASGILLGGIIRTHKAKRPPFEDDSKRIGHELEKMVQEGFETFYLGHGGPLQAKEVERHARYLRSM